MLSTAPADRPAAEAAVSELYCLTGLRPPRFRWVSSPLLAMSTGEPGLFTPPSCPRLYEATHPVLQAFSDLRWELEARVFPGRTWFDEAVSTPLSKSWNACVHSVAFVADGEWGSVWLTSSQHCWDPAWVDFAPSRDWQSARVRRLWATLARSCGSWWPEDGLCVLSDRPESIHYETAGELDQVRLHRADGPAVRYRDGWELHYWHGTRVPEWVITDPTAAAIDLEPRAEVRRCAIEHLGLPEYLEQADTRLLAAAPDPGNHGFEVKLYDPPHPERVVVAVNGSLERDGTRRRYGLCVPGHFTDPVAAVAWTYGLSAAQYSTLAHRT